MPSSLMFDDKTNRGPEDRSRISLSEDYEVLYWTDALGVSEERLREVFGRAGSGAETVRGGGALGEVAPAVA